MSSSSVDDLSELERTAKPPPPPANLTPGRRKLRKWLGRIFRVVITDGRILIGVFNCTDKDANIVLAGCVEYLTDDGEPRILGNVMIPGKHIISIDVERRPEDSDDPDLSAPTPEEDNPSEGNPEGEGRIDELSAKGVPIVEMQPDQSERQPPQVENCQAQELIEQSNPLTT